ncbi:MAG: cation transporter [Planctomycetota bacterium]|nr:MAG: cation transporter [Planctomycetota bacterium]
MIARVIDFALNNRLLVIVLWLLVAVLGIRSMGELPIDAVPDVTNVQVQVLTNSPGLAPQEVESFITFPVEAAMSGLPNVEEIRSVSKFGLSAVTVVFEEGTDIYWARQLVGERLVEARGSIPDGYGEPEMGPISTGLGEIYQFEVRGDGHSPMELRTILDWIVNYQLRSVPGVVEVNAFGGELKTYQVTLDPQRLVSLGIPLSTVFEAIEANNRSVGGGYIVHADEQYLVRGQALVENVDDLASVVVARDAAGTPVLLEHLGDVEPQPMLRQGAVTRDGRGEAVVGVVMMLMGANARTVAEDVHARVGEIAKGLPEGVEIDTFYNRTELVDRTIGTVTRNLVEGGLLVVFVLLLLLGDLRAGLLVAASIPISMLVALLAMERFGVSGNLMSLGAVDFGIIVDGSIVIVENIVRRLRTDGSDVSVPHLEKIRQACHEVARPVVFAVGIITVVYLPVLALRGIEGKMFRPMALTVVFAMGGSLICALTLMPVLASIFLKRVRDKDPLLFRLAKRLYEPALKRTVARPGRTLTVAVVAFLACLSLVPGLGAEFMPRLDEGTLAMQIWRLPSISLESSNKISTDVEAVVMEFPEVDSVVSRTGRPEIATDPMGVEISDTYILLQPRETWRFATTEQLVEALKDELDAQFRGVVFSFSQPIELRVAELISGVRSDVGIQIYAGGGTLDDMNRVAEQVAAAVREVEGMEEVKAEQTLGLPTVTIDVDRAAIARLGVDAEDVLDVVETLGGRPVGTVIEGQRRFAIQVRFDSSVRQDLSALGDLPVALEVDAAGQRADWVPLKQVANVSISTGPAQISREKIQRKITVEANVRGRDLASAVEEARLAVEAKVELPAGWFLEWGGQFENLRAASSRLSLLLPLALLMIFVLLYTAFGSSRMAALIFLNLPLAAAGGILALSLRDYPFSISAGVGFIALFGVAVMNGVVLVEAILKGRRDGVPAKEAALAAGRTRLRPVLMTALTDVIGFLPMATAMTAGAEVQRPLATVVIGGLVGSFFLTLMVLPSLSQWFASPDDAQGSAA